MTPNSDVAISNATGLHALRLRTDCLVDPIGIGAENPEFSWLLGPRGADLMQVAYMVQVAEGEDFTDALLWESGRIESHLPYGVRYAGAPLTAATAYSWRVRVWSDKDDEPGPWSESVTFETGIDNERWSADSWITGPEPSSPNDDAALYLRGNLTLPAAVVRGRAHATALGWYRLFVNGVDITGPSLVPRWTPFDDVVEHQTYDVTEAFRSGHNVVAIAVGDGRFRGRLGFLNRRRVYGDRLAASMQVELDLADGTTVTWETGKENWFAGPGRITGSDPKYGERIDYRISDEDWLDGHDVPSRFAPAEILPHHPRRVISEEVPRVGEVERLAAQRVWRSPSGKQLVDFGQNAAGVVCVRLSGPAGSTVTLTHSELTTADGELDTEYIQANKKRPWFQRDQVVLDGVERWFQPWFTIHGFRYLEVDGLTSDLTIDDVEFVVLSSRLSTTGSFSCSDQRLTQLWQNVFWSTRSNFTDTATDCPTRERSGWTGDIQVFTPAATGILDSQAFLRRYMSNMAIDQRPDGRVLPFVPGEISSAVGRVMVTLAETLANSAGWGDVAVRTPWDMYRYYGDTRVLEEQYTAMCRWVGHMEREARTKKGLQRRFVRTRVGHLERYILDSGFHWGEWLRPGETFPLNILEGPRRGAVVATAYFASSARLLAQIAEVLGRQDDATRYTHLADNVRRAWQAAFIRADGRIGTDRQDDYVRALAFDLVPSTQRPAATARLVDLIEDAGDHLGTGFLSTPLLLATLVDNGRSDVAFRLLMQDTSPSWLHQVTLGATTVWETWEGYSSDGRGEASHNHYAFGAVVGWLRESLLGITPLEPGYRRVGIAPVIGGALSFAEGSVETPFGTVSVQWRVDGPTTVLDTEIPTGTDARVQLPDGRVHDVGPGRHTFEWTTSEPARLVG
ncbi:family 78 glycoside hydrolase catalytic domain [Rhodococcus fascians]|nr:family 78 glycoside hydrolase catalytic domain [Rhodococcus fascians]